MAVTISNVKTFLVNPVRVNLVVVKIETNQPGLYGVGCATFTQRDAVVKTAVEEYLKERLIGKDVANIENIWNTLYTDSYWRNGPVLNNAISGVDEALWDIKGKMANMPVYDLLGGKCREGAAVYRHARGADLAELDDMISQYLEEGYRYLRIQKGAYGGNNHKIVKTRDAVAGAYYDPKEYMRSVVETFEHARVKFGNEPEFCHDIHERLAPIQSLQLAKQLEPYQLFFLEDALPPDQVQWFKFIREQTSVPIAMGELFNNPMEWMDLIVNRYIDFIRVHISQIGGITPAIKLAHLCEAFGVRTAWHGPSDLTPIGAAAQLHLDLHCHNFGIQEFAGFREAEQELFPGCPTVEHGYLYSNGKPGLGVDFDEKVAEKYPAREVNRDWLNARLPDGTPARP